jgi:multidrug efflux pump subunit AcrA (membrane-fusion protein)
MSDAQEPEAVTAARDEARVSPARPPRSLAGWLVGAVALAGAVAAGVWAWQANMAGGRPAMDMEMKVSGAGSAHPVTTVDVARGTVTGSVTYTGSVAALNEEDVFPRVTGRIVDMPVYPGDVVKPGQVVARLDDVELMSRVREAEAMLATAQANRVQMEADLVAASHGVIQAESEVAMVDAELANARAIAARSERLVRSGAVAQQEYETERAMAAALEAKRDAAVHRIEQARGMEAAARKKLEAGGSMVAQAQAQLRTTQVVRDYVEITAPAGGVVVKRLVAPGVLVQPGMAILKLAQIDRIRLQANVGERDVAAIRVGTPVSVTTAVPGQVPLELRVTAVFPFVDPGGRTAVVEAIADNPGRRLFPGQFVTMRFVTGSQAQALSVPQGAVVRLGGRATVWTVEGEEVQPREVTTGLETAERVEILSGLEAGQRVVVRGHEGLYAGAHVRMAGAADKGNQTGSHESGGGGKAERPRPAVGDKPAAKKETGHAGH